MSAELEKEKELLLEITRATDAERIRWLPTARLNEYTGSFNGRWSVLVGRDAEGEYYAEITDDRGWMVLRLTSRDIPVLSSPASGGIVETMVNPVRNLFETASRNAFRSNKRIDEFIQDLKRA